MDEKTRYFELKDLDAYKFARQYSASGWEIYQSLDWQTKKIIGDQTVSSIDSVGANIAEGYGRFHYLDKNKFYYNARGSLLESKHWIEILFERKLISEEKYKTLITLNDKILLRLNGLIKSQYYQKNNF